MENQTKLTLIKVIHTLIWVFFNFVIFYMLYAAIANKLDLWLWIGYGFVFLEGLTLLTFNKLWGFKCQPFQREHMNYNLFLVIRVANCEKKGIF
jgi:hypothetical protein